MARSVGAAAAPYDGTIVADRADDIAKVAVGGTIVAFSPASRDSTSLQRWFVALLVVVAIYTATRSGLALR